MVNAFAWASGTGATITLNKTAAQLTSAYGVVWFVRRADNTVPTPSSPSGVTLLGSSMPTSGYGLHVFYKRCTGAFNALTLSAAPNFQLALVYPVYDDSIPECDFFPSSGSVTSRGATGLTASEAGMNAAAYLVTSAGFGSTPAWAGGFTTDTSVYAPGSASSNAWAEKSLPAAGDAANASVSWSTARTATMAVVRVKSTDPTPPLVETQFYRWVGGARVPIYLVGRYVAP